MDRPTEWLEVSGPTVDVAVQGALDELGLDSPDQVTVEVIQEGKRGVLGMGGREAIVKVSRLPKKRRRRRRRGSGSTAESGLSGSDQAQRRKGESERRGGEKQQKRKSGSGGVTDAPAGEGPRSRGGARPQDDRRSNGRSGGQTDRGARRRGGRDGRERQVAGAGGGGAGSKNATKEEAMPTADISEQADVAREFLEGLLESFGLEGQVTTRVEEDILYLDVSGDQTEALVGSKGSIMNSVLEITRTVVQRKTFGAPRMRLDIAGYGERRRAALVIYAGKLAEQVKDQGDEIMLEPMNPADRKVVHDAIAEIEGVRSFSEGEDPNRAVVIALD